MGSWSRSIATPELVPIRVAPACIIANACSNVRIQPDAFT